MISLVKLIYLPCDRCKMYWEDLKYCQFKDKFLPDDKCEDYEEEEENVEEYVNREEIV